MSASALLDPTTRCSVRRLDGVVEEVAVRRLTLRELYRFVAVDGGHATPGIVAQAGGRELEWIDSLEDRGFATLAAIVTRENSGAEQATPSTRRPTPRRTAPRDSNPWATWERLVARCVILGVCGGDWEKVLDMTPGRIAAIVTEATRINLESTRATANATAAGFAGGDGLRSFVNDINHRIESAAT